MARQVLEYTLDHNENDTQGGVTTMYLGVQRKYHYVRAPDGIEGVKPGSKLRVLEQFTSNERGPLGKGLTCLKLEARLIAVFTPNGIAWLHAKMM